MPDFLNCQLFLKKHFGFVSLLTLFLLVACDAKIRGTDKRDLPQDFQISGVSREGLFSVDLFTADKNPPPVGKYHDWIIVLTDRASNPVSNARLSVTGGMPAHGHGLPSKPEVTKNLGNGHYLLEGILFTMDGNWLLQVSIMTEGQKDAVDLKLDLGY